MSFAYDEMYISQASRVMGDMLDYAVNTLKINIREFFDMFIVSKMAYQFEIGNPTYISGKNGCEVAKEVIKICTDEYPNEEDCMYIDKSPEYWIGWALAQYQWYRSIDYAIIDSCQPIEDMYGMYKTLHEADISLFIEVMDEKISTYRQANMLRRLRKYAELSQSQLATKSDVPLRQIQLFEQGQRDINKTQGETLRKLANTLNCRIEDLIS